MSADLQDVEIVKLHGGSRVAYVVKVCDVDVATVTRIGVNGAASWVARLRGAGRPVAPTYHPSLAHAVEFVTR